MESDLSLSGKELAFTGRLVSMTRSEAVARVVRAGGRHVETPSPSTAILVAASAAGNLDPRDGIAKNLLKYRELKEAGAPIRLIEETDFLKMLGAEEELADLSRLYTAVQVSRIVEVPLAEIRSWLRHGLLQPARMTNRLAWFEYRDILLARNLSRLAAAGVAGSEIRRGLELIARWLPDGEWILGRLDAAEKGLRLRLGDGGWAEPTGQRLLDFEPRPRVAPSVVAFPGAGQPAANEPFAANGALTATADMVATAAETAGFWFERAVEAEEAGDMNGAAAGYRKSLEASQDAVTCFNLGNVLYELGREADAAESYLAALDLDQDFVEAWNNLGNSLAALGKADDAIMAYRRALVLEPGYPDAHCNLALVLERLGRSDAGGHRAACIDAYPSERRLRLIRSP